MDYLLTSEELELKRKSLKGNYVQRNFNFKDKIISKIRSIARNEKTTETNVIINLIKEATKDITESDISQMNRFKKMTPKITSGLNLFQTKIPRDLGDRMTCLSTMKNTNINDLYNIKFEEILSRPEPIKIIRESYREKIKKENKNIVNSYTKIRVSINKKVVNKVRDFYPGNATYKEVSRICNETLNLFFGLEKKIVPKEYPNSIIRNLYIKKELLEKANKFCNENKITLDNFLSQIMEWHMAPPELFW